MTKLSNPTPEPLVSADFLVTTSKVLLGYPKRSDEEEEAGRRNLLPISVWLGWEKFRSRVPFQNKVI